MFIVFIFLINMFTFRKELLDPISMKEFPLSRHQFKMIAITILGFITASFGFTGILTVNLAISNLIEAPILEGEPKKFHLDSVKKYLDLRDLLQKVLRIIGILLGLTMLATAALQKAILPFNGEYYLSTQFLFVYGLGFSLYIAIIYIPVLVRLNSIGYEMRDIYIGSLPENYDEWSAWFSKKDTIEGHLGLKTDFKEKLGKAITIMAPVIASGIPDFLIKLKDIIG